MSILDRLNTMSEAIANVYQAISERVIVNMARFFRHLKSDEAPGGAFEYQAQKLAELGRLNRETMDIIRTMSGKAGEAVEKHLETIVRDSIEPLEKPLREAVEKRIFKLPPAYGHPPQGGGPAPPAELSPRMTRAFEMYARQSADKLNLVNTVMLESTANAYRSTVRDITARMRRTQDILNTAAGSVVTGTEAFNQAQRRAVELMVDNGIAGFIDHSGRRWRPETYVEMDMRSTYHATARESFWEQTKTFGDDLFLVSQHPGARPLCYPWQCKVISRDNNARWVEDGDGNPVQVFALSETTYGEPAGLFGINCGHHPMLFIPGVTKVPTLQQNEEENAEAYAVSQQHRALERQFRRARLDMQVAKARGDDEALKAAKARLQKADGKLDAFTEAHNRKRRREREYGPKDVKWPQEGSYGASPTETRDKLEEFFRQRRPGQP